VGLRDSTPEPLFDLRIGRFARRVCRAERRDLPDHICQVRRDIDVMCRIRWEWPVQHRAANALRRLAHRDEREPRPVRRAEQVPLVIAEGEAQVAEVVRAGHAVVLREVDPVPLHGRAAAGQRVAPPRQALVIRHERGFEEDAAEFGAEGRLRKPRPARVEQHDIPLGAHGIPEG
jgi:hypothetical protein